MESSSPAQAPTPDSPETPSTSNTTPQRKGEVEVALPRLKHNRGRQDARPPVDIATDQHHRADLGNDRAEARRQAHANAHPRLIDHRADGLPARRAETAELHP